MPIRKNEYASATYGALSEHELSALGRAVRPSAAAFRTSEDRQSTSDGTRVRRPLAPRDCSPGLEPGMLHFKGVPKPYRCRQLYKAYFHYINLVTKFFFFCGSR